MTFMRIGGFCIWFMLGLGYTHAARATCWDNCSQECSLYANGTDAGTCVSRCAANCTQEPVADVEVHVPQYGAIAISNATLENAYSYNYATQSEAEDAALSICRQSPKNPQDCEVGVWFYDACGALAVSAQNAWGANWKDSQEEAEQSALELCRNSGEQGCEIVTSFCSR